MAFVQVHIFGISLMHLSILCPTTPLPGYVGEKVGHLTCFDTKTRPIRGEFDCSPYACATIKSTSGQIPHLYNIDRCIIYHGWYRARNISIG